jgi:AcrR family transcriptional regulator
MRTRGVNDPVAKPDSYPKALGLREQNKLDKRLRIRAAARELFSRHGYDAATLRQIAKRANVGLGTLFAYAKDKRDLIFLVANEELSAILDDALQRPKSNQSLADQIVALFDPHYRYFGKDPELSRLILRELVFYSDGKQAAPFHLIRSRFLGAIEELVRAAQRKGRIRAREEAGTLARYIFYLTSGEIRRWIASPYPRPVPGLAELRHVIQLCVDGLQPSVKFTDGDDLRVSRNAQGSNLKTKTMRRATAQNNSA